MVSSVDGLAGAAAIGSSGAAAASRSCVGGGNRSLGGEQALDFTPDEQASPPDIALAQLHSGICCTAPKSRSKATIRVGLQLRDHRLQKFVHEDERLHRVPGSSAAGRDSLIRRCA